MKKYLCTLAIGLSTHLAYGKTPIQHPTCDLYLQHLLNDGSEEFATAGLTQLLVDLGYNPIIIMDKGKRAENTGDLTIGAQLIYKKEWRIYYSIEVSLRLMKRRAKDNLQQVLSAVMSYKKVFREPTSTQHFLSAARKLPRCEIVPAQ